MLTIIVIGGSILGGVLKSIKGHKTLIGKIGAIANDLIDHKKQLVQVAQDVKSLEKPKN